MEIKEIQKFTLIDYPGKLACTLFLAGCNFRCGFCHNPELISYGGNESISEKEILDFLKKRKGQLDGVCITGGEPLLSLEKDFLKQIKSLGYFIKIDTNGSFPERLKEFIEEGLVDYVAMDIKSSKEKYSEIVGSNVDTEKVEKSIKLISGLENYEFRTTIVERIHSKEEIRKMAEWLNEVVDGKPKKIFLQGFKNTGKILSSEFVKEKDTSENYLKELKKDIEDYFKEVGVRV